MHILTLFLFLNFTSTFEYAWFYEVAPLQHVVDTGKSKQYFFSDLLGALNQAGSQGWEVVLKENNKYLVKRQLTDEFLDQMKAERDRYRQALQDIRFWWMHPDDFLFITDVIQFMVGKAQEAVNVDHNS